MDKQLHDQYRFFDRVTVNYGFFKCHNVLIDVDLVSIRLQMTDFKIHQEVLNTRDNKLNKRCIIMSLTERFR